MIISWNVTNTCNLKCKHCYRDAGIRDPQELSSEEARSLISEIAAAGFKILILSGGEPLMRRDIYDLITFASASGVRPVLGTNGTLIDRETARHLKKAGAVRIGISLDSVNASVHDEFRQESGAWEKTVNAMKICASEGLDFQVHTTLTKYNSKEIECITDFVAAAGSRAHHIFFLVPTGRGKDITDVCLDETEYKRVLTAILKKQQKIPMELKPVCAPQFIPLAREMGMDLRFQRGCLAGISYCCILPNGDVHPCPYMPVRIGNVREIPFSVLWKTNNVFREMRSLEYKGRCGVCAYKDACGGCRARAFHMSGDYMAQDPDCFCCKVTTEHG
ncbi:MAG: radical SAM protein [Candidatus Omnitrophica bacterium]|nr:radical SAM protein [Candidatus Omnitrophota bacterium]